MNRSLAIFAVTGDVWASAVLDSSGAAIPACLVTATHSGTGAHQTVNTDSVGSFVFPAPFASSTAPPVALTESVSVSAGAEQVQTNSGSIGKIINDQQVRQTSGFGAVNAAGPGRVMEFALKLLFRSLCRTR